MSGEWEGHSVYFDAAGTPIALPRNVVPPAFAEWGVELVDWQSQCAMRADDDAKEIYARELRFLPTVGCEADASTVESAIERRVAFDDVTPAPPGDDAPGGGNGVEFGSYSAGPGSLAARDGEETTIVMEHALAFTTGSGEDAKRTRLRLRQTISPVDGAIESIVGWKEYWYEPFNDAASLCSSCGGPNKWGETLATDPAATVSGPGWRGDDWRGLSDAAVMLREGVWSDRAVLPDGGGVVYQIGWHIPDRDAVYLPPCREVETHLVSEREYDGDGNFVGAKFMKLTRPAPK